MNAPLRHRRVMLWNAVFGYGSLALTLTRNILLVPVYLHFVPLAEYGAWLATGGALVQLLMTDYGLAGVVTQRIAARSGGGELARVRELIAAALVNALLLGLALAAVGSLIAAVLPATQGLDAAQVRRVLQCFLIAVLANAIGVLAATSAAAVRGLQRPVAAGLAAIAADVLGVTMTVVGLLAGWNLYALAAGLLTRSCILAAGCLVTLAGFARTAPGGGFSWTVALALWRDSGRFFVTSIAMRLQSQANVLAIGMVAGPASAAVYGLTVRAHETVLIVLGQLNSALGPVLAHLSGAGEEARLDALIRRFLPFTAAAAAGGAMCVVVLNESFVTLWVGPGIYAGLALTLGMSAALWIASIGYVAYEALLARGEFAFIARGFAWAAVVHVTLLATLLQFGAVAAPFALCVSSGLWAVLFWRRVGFHAPDRAAVGASFAGVLVVGVALLPWLPVAHSWWVLIAQALAVAAACAFALLAVSPTLRRLIRAEFTANWRSMRAA
jgi:O-antigen/teichoic acid export membrane protein